MNVLENKRELTETLDYRKSPELAEAEKAE